MLTYQRIVNVLKEGKNYQLSYPIRYDHFQEQKYKFTAEEIEFRLEADFLSISLLDENYGRLNVLSKSITEPESNIVWGIQEGSWAVMIEKIILQLESEIESEISRIEKERREQKEKEEREYKISLDFYTKKYENFF